jgi:hypothetical protein
MKSRRMSWSGYVEQIGEMRNTYKVSVVKLERKIRRLGVNEVIMKWILEK